jgi:hypothetical protein
MLIAWFFSAPAAGRPGVYLDPHLLFSFEYPAGLQVNEVIRQQSMSRAWEKVQGDTETSKAMACLQTLLVAVENPRTSAFRMLDITRLDLDCRKESTSAVKLDELTEAGLRTALTMVGRPVIDKALSYRLAKHPASVVEGRIDPQASVSKGPIFGEASCAIIAHSVVCFSAMAADRARVRQVLEGGITFDSGKEQPLVQAGLLAP